MPLHISLNGMEMTTTQAVRKQKGATFHPMPLHISLNGMEMTTTQATPT